MQLSINPERNGIIVSEYCNSTYYFLEFGDYNAVFGSFVDDESSPKIKEFESVYEAFLYFMMITQDIKETKNEKLAIENDYGIDDASTARSIRG